MKLSKHIPAINWGGVFFCTHKHLKKQYAKQGIFHLDFEEGKKRQTGNTVSGTKRRVF